LDASGKPVVSYRRVGVNGGSNNLKLVHCGNANCTPTGSGQVDPTVFQTARSAWFTPSLNTGAAGATTRSLTLKVWVNGGTGTIQAARLKIVQTSSTKITDTQSQVELGDNQTITATSATELTYPKYYYYDSAKFSGTKSAYMEASLQGEGTGQGSGRLWSSGFELNSNTAGMEFDTVVGTTSVQNTTVRSGSYAGQINVTTASGRFQHSLAASATDMDIYTRVYFRFATVPSASAKIYFIGRAATNSVAVVYNAANAALDLNRCTNIGCSTYANIGSSSNNSIVVNTWYRLEVHYDSTPGGTGADIVEAKLDGSSFASSTGQTLATVTYTATGIVVNTVTANMFLDDWAINDTTGSWPGPGNIIHLHPSATGQNIEWTASAGTNYATVDEVTPNDGTDYVSTVTSNNIDDYYITGAASAITDGEAADINVVQVGVRFANSAAGTETFTVHISNNISEYTDTGSSITSNDSVTYGTNAAATVGAYTLTSYNIPGSGTEKWTPAELDRSQIGIQKTSATGSVSIRVSTIWALVDYTPVADMTGTAVNAKLQQCDEASCSWTDVHATLGTVTNASASWKRIRTADLTANLTSGRLYRIVFWKSAASGTLKVANAKLIIGQTDAAGITTTQMVVHYVNTSSSTTNTSYADTDYLNYHDPANYYSGTFNYYFEADIKTSAGTGYARLRNDTDGTAISSSEVTTTSTTSYERKRSAAITPPSTAKNLDTQIQASASNTTYVSNSWMIVDVTNFQIPEKIIYLLPLAILVPYFLKKRREQREMKLLWARN